MKRIFALLALALVSTLFAEPRQWDVGGIPVYAVRSIMDFSTASRTNGTTLIVWAQSQGREQVVMGQLLAADGQELWPEGGRMIAQGLYKAAFPVVAAVQNGWIIAWLDARLISSESPNAGWYGVGSMRATMIDNTGAPQWTGGLAGIVVVPETSGWMQQEHSIHPSLGGVIVTWSLEDQWAMKISANGVLEWPEPVRLKARLNSAKTNITSDLAGSLLFAWYNIIGSDTILYANKLLTNGTFAWNDTSGVEVTRERYRFKEIGVCSDDDGGMFVTWGTQLNLSEPYVQHINSQGNLTWVQGGVQFADVNYDFRLRSISRSYASGIVDGVMAVFSGGYETDTLFAQKVNLDGTPAWGDGGLLACVPDTTYIRYSRAKIVSDQSGGMLCSYVQDSFDWPRTIECCVVRISHDGTRLWGEDCGVTVSLPTNGSIYNAFPVLQDGIVRLQWMENTYMNSTLRSQRLNITTGVPEYAEPHVHVVGDQGTCENLQIVKLGGGTTAIAWAKQTWFGTELLFQIQDAFGTPMFEQPGRPLVVSEDGEPMDVRMGALAPDGSGGFFAAFASLEGNYYVLRMVHLDGQGNFISSSQGETILIPGTLEVERNSIHLLADGEGGCFVSAGMYSDLFYLVNVTTRVNAECETVWPAAVIRDDIYFDVTTHLISPSTDNSAIVTYSIGNYPYMSVYAVRISEDGQVLWDYSFSPDSIRYSSDVGVCSDNQNGVFLAWEFYGPNDTFGARAQRITAAGELRWDEEGLVFVQGEGSTSDFSCSADQLGNVNIAWEQYAVGWQLDIYAQRISASGGLMWGEDGIALCQANHDQENPKLITISDTEVYVLWSDSRDAYDGSDLWNLDIYATHLNARGQIRDDSYWQVNGSPVCNLEHQQRDLVAADDGAGGVTVVWMDDRTTQAWEYSVFAQRLYDPIYSDANETPVVVSEFSLSQNYPNPFNPETVIEFALPTTGQTSLVVFDITGREVATLVDNPLTAGNHRVLFDGSKLASGVYFYSLRTASQSLTRKMVMLK